MALLGGAPFPWWVAGGWALEAAGLPPRPHSDLDVAVRLVDVPAVRDWLSGYELWDAYRDVLTPLAEPRHQAWLRHGPGSPWLMDLLFQPGEDEWAYRRDPRLRVPLGAAGHVVGGVPYLRPELVLLFKLRLDRPVDRADVATMLPLLSEEARDWLRGAFAVAYPGLPWPG